ncbi:hypothetical protein BKH46_06305 [Helicobacter sp. 12S02634-8]|nr:hypothetical protein BKH46_06305 [Helicobacter sp. 12S02634-8]
MHNFVSADGLKLLVGVDTQNTDSVYRSRLTKGKLERENNEFYGYEGYIGGKLGLEYFLSRRNGVRVSIGVGYMNMRLLDKRNQFVLYSGVGVKTEADYLFNYYCGERFNFGAFVGASYMNSYHTKKSEHILIHQLLAILGVNMTIDSKHRLELTMGVPFFSQGFYSSDLYKNIAINKGFNSFYYGFSYAFLFALQ